MVMGALVNFMPEQVMACSQGTSAILTLGGVDPRNGRHYVSYETVKGGFGARPNKDGINCIASGISNTMNTPVEVLEMAFPVRVECYEVNPDSGGAGRYRGGCGARRVWRMLEGADATGALCMERMTSPPFGLRGGNAGAAAVVTLTTPDGVTRHLPSKGAFAAPAGSVIDMITPGSGGFGPAAERDPAAIGRDLLDGYVSRLGRKARLRHYRSGGFAEERRSGGRSVTYIPNSIEARDVASLVHMQTNLRKHQEEGPLVIARGEGCRVFDDSGREYIESVAGLWCASLGFGSERLAKVAYEQMRKLGYYHLYRHRSTEPAIALAEELLKIAPVPMARVVFQCSGSEANDTAIKLAWYYWNAVGEPQRTKIIARQMAYHGNTCAAVSLSGKPDMHAGFGLPFANFKHTEFPHYYRRHEPGETEVEFSDRMAEALETLIQAEGPDTIAAFFAEPVMGAGGAILPPQGYFEKIQAVLRKYDILFVADEVICGFARTGEMWGCQTFGIRPDMLTSAKALSAAMQPISAVLINDRIHEAMLAQSDKFGNFAHGFTYAGHPVAAAVALEVQKIYAEMDIVTRAKRLGAVLQSTLGRLKSASARRRRARGRAHPRHGADAGW